MDARPGRRRKRAFAGHDPAPRSARPQNRGRPHLRLGQLDHEDHGGACRGSGPTPARHAGGGVLNLRFAQICANLTFNDRPRIRSQSQEARPDPRRPGFIRQRSRQRQSWPTLLWKPLHDVEGPTKGNRPWAASRDAAAAWADSKGPGELIMAFGYRYRLEHQDNGWCLVRFPGIPEALTEGETEKEARADALDCVLAALEGYMKAGKPLPRQGASHS